MSEPACSPGERHRWHAWAHGQPPPLQRLIPIDAARARRPASHLLVASVFRRVFLASFFRLAPRPNRSSLPALDVQQDVHARAIVSHAHTTRTNTAQDGCSPPNQRRFGTTVSAAIMRRRAFANTLAMHPPILDSCAASSPVSLGFSRVARPAHSIPRKNTVGLHDRRIGGGGNRPIWTRGWCKPHA